MQQHVGLATSVKARNPVPPCPLDQQGGAQSREALSLSLFGESLAGVTAGRPPLCPPPPSLLCNRSHRPLLSSSAPRVVPPHRFCHRYLPLPLPPRAAPDFAKALASHSAARRARRLAAVSTVEGPRWNERGKRREREREGRKEKEKERERELLSSVPLRATCARLLLRCALEPTPGVNALLEQAITLSRGAPEKRGNLGVFGRISGARGCLRNRRYGQ